MGEVGHEVSRATAPPGSHAAPHLARGPALALHLVQKLHLEDDPGVLAWRVREARDDHPSAIHIREVQPLAGLGVAQSLPTAPRAGQPSPGSARTLTATHPHSHGSQCRQAGQASHRAPGPAWGRASRTPWPFVTFQECPILPAPAHPSRPHRGQGTAFCLPSAGSGAQGTGPACSTHGVAPGAKS